ncbi:MAG: hypothetical protein QM599_07225 [Pseudoxanthomonas sp.]
MSDTVRRLPLPWLLLAAAPTAFAAAEAAHPCATVADPAARLACYDKAFPPPPAVHEAATKKAVQEFGLEKQAAPLFNPGQTREDADPERIESRVAKVDYAGGTRTISLENGQVWTLAEANSRGPLKAGDAVHVRKGLLGSYLLVTPAGVGLRVRRVR